MSKSLSDKLYGVLVDHNDKFVENGNFLNKVAMELSDVALAHSHKAILPELLKKLDDFEGNGIMRLILYSDGSGHIEERVQGHWDYGFKFNDIADLDEYLTNTLISPS